MIINALGITIVPMKIEEAEMTGIPTTEGNATTEAEDAREMSRAATDVRRKITLEMTGFVANVVTQISHSGQNAIVVEHQRDAVEEVHPKSGLAMIEELATGMKLHNQGQEIGNVASARK